MKTLGRETIVILAAGLFATAVLGTPVHAGSGVHAAGQSGGMGMMQERGLMMGCGEDMEMMGQAGMPQRGGRMMGGRQGMMEGDGPMQMMGGEMMGGMRQMQQAMHELDLTKEQRTELRAMRHAHREAQFERMARMMNLREDLHALMASEQPDPREVQAQHGRMAEIHGEMLAEQVRLRNSMRQLLTHEQRRELQRRTSAGQASEPSDQEEEGHEDHH